MSFALTRPPWLDATEAELKRLSANNEEAATVRAQMRRSEEAAEGGLARFREDVDFVLKGMASAAQNEAWAGVDELIEWFARGEKEDAQKARAVAKVFEATLRKAAAARPDFLAAINDHYRHFKAIHQGWQEVYQSARWRLMALRALHDPSRPAGPIKGQATDLDEYLKTLSNGSLGQG